jgi:hypothetical protein
MKQAAIITMNKKENNINKRASNNSKLRNGIEQGI